MILRDAGLDRTFLAVADRAHASHERVVHQRVKLLGEALALGSAFPARKLKVLGGVFVLAALSGLQESDHGPVRSASSEWIDCFILGMLVFLRVWFFSLLT